MNVELAKNLVDAQEVGSADVPPLSTTVTTLLREPRVVAVVGSRRYPEPERVRSLIHSLPRESMVVSGGALGIDVLAARLARERDLGVVELIPSAEQRGNWIKAALLRDQWFGLVADVVVAFWDGQSKGTRETISYALRRSGKCIVVLPGEKPAVWVPR